MRRSLRTGNREISKPSARVIARTASGRPEAVADDERHGEVGHAIVAKKLTNEAAKASKESVERRGGTEEGGKRKVISMASLRMKGGLG